MQLAAGAVGINCQKVSEAEAMVAGAPDLSDVLITYNIVGAEKLARLAALARRVTLGVVADSAAVVEGLSAPSPAEPSPLRVLGRVQYRRRPLRRGDAGGGRPRSPAASPHRPGSASAG